MAIDQSNFMSLYMDGFSSIFASVSEFVERSHSSPYLLGITGTAPAVGKTTISNCIAGHLGADQAVSIDLDNWINISRQERKRSSISGVDPMSWDLRGLARSLSSIRAGKSELDMPIYDHITGQAVSRFDRISLKPFCVMAGAAILWPTINRYFNYVICIEPTDARRFDDIIILRNIRKRNYSLHEAKEDLLATICDYENYIIPHVELADSRVNVDPDYKYSIGPVRR